MLQRKVAEAAAVAEVVEVKGGGGRGGGADGGVAEGVIITYQNIVNK